MVIPAAKEGTTSSSKLPCRLNEVRLELHPAGHSSSFRTVRGWAGAASWPEPCLVDHALQPLREQKNQDCGFHLERQWVSGRPLVFIYLRSSCLSWMGGKLQVTSGPWRWCFRVGAWESSRLFVLSLSFFLSGTFAPLRSLGTRGGAQSGDSGIRQFPGLPQEPERLGAKGREATTIWRLM